MNFLRDFVKQIKDEDTNIVADGKGAAEYTGCIDTGCYMLNAVLSGSIFGGVPNNKITGFAGETTTGKTFFALSIVKNFLDANPDGGVVYYDTEAAVTKKMMEDRGIDPERVVVAEPDTIQKFRHHALRMLEMYRERYPKDDGPPMVFVLDSLGMLSTTKEMEDSLAGVETKDMTKAQLIKATFRVLTLKLAKVQIPMIVTNHVYDKIGDMSKEKEIGGGSGLKFAASTIATMTKAKDKEGTDIVGTILRVKMYKSRLSKENAFVKIRLSYATGLDKYYGLLDLVDSCGVWKKLSTQYEIDGKKYYAKTIYKEPEKFFTPDVLEVLDKEAKRLYSYGTEDINGTEVSEVNAQ